MNNNAPSNLHALRKQEQEKYNWISKVEGSTYGSSFHGKKATRYIRTLHIDSIADIGTGRGEFCKWAADNLCDTVYGVDFAFDPLEENKSFKIKYYKAFAHKLPLTNKSVDMLTSFDMLEHLLEDDIDNVLTEFKRVCKKYFVFTIAFCDSISYRKEIGSLHPTVRPREWWMEKLEAYGKIIHDSSFFVVDVS